MKCPYKLDESENVHRNKMSIQYIYISDPKMSEWASKNVVGITCPIDQGGWSKKVLFLNEHSYVFYQNPQSELLKVCMAFKIVDKDL